MKTWFGRFSAVCCLTLFAFTGVPAQEVAEQDGDEPKPPEELQKLQDNYQAAKDRLEAPVKAKYTGALQNLKDSLTRSDRLEEALVIDQVLGSLNSGTDEIPENNISELARLHKLYEHSRTEATRRVEDIYKTQLRQLKANYTGAGKLAEAIIVDKELSKLTEADSEVDELTQKVLGIIKDQVVEFRSHHYLLIRRPLSQPNASDLCKKLGGHLIFIETKTEDEFFAEKYAEVWDTLRQNVWIGATDVEEEGTWVWENGEKLRHEGWKPPEPNNNGDEDGAVLSRGGWYDLGLHHQRWALCEWETWPPKVTGEIDLEVLRVSQ
ncbi:MAG: lectin-like protein [Verrucomicrobiota bacterium]